LTRRHGLGVPRPWHTRAAIEPLQLVPIDNGDERWISPEELQQFREFRAPKSPHYALVGCLDSMCLHRRNLMLVAPSDREHPLFAAEIKAGGALQDLPSHAIIDRGRVVGLWEYDVESQSIVWCSFAKKYKRLIEAVRQTELFVRDQLGDARSFSLDSPKSRSKRIDAIRAHA